jgi:hypothetical protein
MLAQADKDGDRQLTREEFGALADAWFDKLAVHKTEPVNREQFAERINEILPPPPGMPGPSAPGAAPPGGAPRRAGGPAGLDPGRFLALGLFAAVDADKDGSLTRIELRTTFARWFDEWAAGRGSLNEENLRNGFKAAMPRPDFGGPGGPGGGMFGGGPELDPLVALNDASKPLRSKLLAVPSLRARYLSYVHDMAEKWLDWAKLGPLAQQYHALIAEDVKADTRKTDSTEDFLNSISGGGDGASAGLKSFADRRRAFLLNHAEVKKAGH